MKITVFKLMAFVALVILGVAEAGAQNVRFEEWFTGGTLRIDCLREGSAQGDTVWVERWYDRQAAWHGSRTQLIDPFDNGDYRVVMRDAETGRELYSRGYSNLFREYKDTPEGKNTAKRFEETLLVPMPKGKVMIAFQKRDKDMKLYDHTVVFFEGVKGSEKGVKEEEVQWTSGQSGCEAEKANGKDVSTKFDVAFVMQGFDGVGEEEYQKVCERMRGVLFGKEPFKSHREDFNLYFVKGDAGVEYNTFGADRYAMTFKVWQLHDVLGTTPCDHIIIVLNNEKYGGGAIYNFYSVTSLHKMAENVLPHELGHGIGGLADEYVDEDLSYADLHRTQYEPLEPNITNLVDFPSKWQSLLPAGTLVPTPDAEVSRTENGPLGVYEGAGYSSKGVYRPAMHCMMRDYAPFCPVCRQRLEAVIKMYTR